ncbi:MAG: NAD(P)/FAD-dependent oxidoreductase [Planctomycetes bacterium]|nr:NAD(P)/FAD-dependent oxidoreductase [Planctomycetota bacterium]
MTIAPTLTLTQAAQRSWDVVVVGSGPAGAMAARECARMGMSVLLLDKSSFPRWKVCGSCLNALATSTLAAVGLGPLPERLGAIPWRRLYLAAGDRVALINLPGGVALSRVALDAALVQAAIESGADFLPETRVVLSAHSRTTNSVTCLRNGCEAEVSSGLVLVATGLGTKFGSKQTPFVTTSASGSRIGAATVAHRAPGFYSPETIYMGCGSGGYVGLVRLEDGSLGIAAAIDPSSVKHERGVGSAATRILDEAGMPAVPTLRDLRWFGTAPLTRHAPTLGGHRLLVLGDAAGYVEPFTGDGIAWALASGVAVAPLARRAIRRWDPSIVDEWTVLHRRIVNRRHFACRAVTKLLRRPTLTCATIRLLSHLPQIAAPLVAWLNKPFAQMEVNRP